MKIKLISGNDRKRVEDMVNTFIGDVGDNHIAGVQFSTSQGPTFMKKGWTEMIVRYDVMISYYESED
jgi:hypothetical protein